MEASKSFVGWDEVKTKDSVKESMGKRTKLKEEDLHELLL